MPGIDFHETYSLVIKPVTIRLVLTLAVTWNWHVRQLDVSNAFHNDPLHEVVYMPQLQGFEDPQRPHHVCRLLKALYGLKQTPRAWYKQLCLTLLQWHFHQSKADPSIFFFRTGSQFIILLVYVDIVDRFLFNSS